MAVRLSCPQGHQWDSQADPVSGARETCPQCGAANTTVATDADPWRTVAYKAEITATVNRRRRKGVRNLYYKVAETFSVPVKGS